MPFDLRIGGTDKSLDGNGKAVKDRNAFFARSESQGIYFAINNDKVQINIIWMAYMMNTA